MRTDSRYSSYLGPAARPPHCLHPPPQFVGAYLHNYEQEFIVSRLVAMGADAFNVLGVVLPSMVASVAAHLGRSPGNCPQAQGFSGGPLHVL